MPAGRRIEKGDDSEKPCGCLPNKAKDYDVIDLPYDRWIMHNHNVKSAVIWHVVAGAGVDYNIVLASNSFHIITTSLVLQALSTIIKVVVCLAPGQLG